MNILGPESPVDIDELVECGFVTKEERLAKQAADLSKNAFIDNNYYSNLGDYLKDLSTSFKTQPFMMPTTDFTPASNKAALNTIADYLQRLHYGALNQARVRFNSDRANREIMKPGYLKY